MSTSAAIASAASNRSFRACGSCQAPVEFDPTSGELKCAFCGARRAIARGRVPHHLLVEMAGLSVPAGSELRTLKCTHCGAQSSVAANVAATQCAFCAAPLANTGNAASPPAEGVIPFALSKDIAGNHFGEWIRGLWFRPSNLKKLARLREVRGIYVPTWAFDARADSSWTAEAGYYYYVEKTVVVNGKEETRREQRVRWEPASGSHSADYSNLLVIASKGLSPGELAAIEPFDLGQLTAFSGDFLAGLEAESHALDVQTCWSEAEKRIERAEYGACGSLVPGDTHRSLSVHTATSNEYVRSFLLPFYVAAYEYAGEIYRVVVNGQTGKVTGKAPWSPWKIAAFVLAMGLAVTALVMFFRLK